MKSGYSKFNSLAWYSAGYLASRILGKWNRISDRIPEKAGYPEDIVICYSDPTKDVEGESGADVDRISAQVVDQITISDAEETLPERIRIGKTQKK